MAAWFYSTDGQVHTGPVSEDQLREMARVGTLGREHLVWREGEADWVAAGTVAGLFPAVAPRAAAAPKPTPKNRAFCHVTVRAPGVHVQVPVENMHEDISVAVDQPERPMRSREVRPTGEASPLPRVAYVLLGLFLGVLGVHNFAAGYVGRGVAQLLVTFFLFWLVLPVVGIWIWNLVEVCVTRTDASGRVMG